ncbi:nitronate monooxygenase [uncultured Chryseobacterium sp.]|uniref:nitronate monooxygenase n=1 Tax=uncultured Chryseobacterium sp. TaxID=259322 RepID=UPI0025D3F7C5|nr:nitronate monooxygenase [uncultured Chryseobacterium sp.]
MLFQVYDYVDVPLIYAGRIYDAKTLLAARLLGAQGFQIGSLLLASVESVLQEFENRTLKGALEKDIVLTKSFSGRYARGLKNIFPDTFDGSEYCHILIRTKLQGRFGPRQNAGKIPDFQASGPGSRNPLTVPLQQPISS